MPAYGIEQAVALAQERNPEILIAHKKVMAARGGFIEARSGYLPSLSSSGLYDKRQTESQTNLRQEDYNAIVKLEQNLYTGGAVGSQVAIAQLNIAKANYDLQETISRVTMDVRIAFNELLLNRAKVRVHEDSVRVFEQELKGEQENFNAGIVGKLNVQRAEVALANERPELFNAQTDLKNSYLRLAELFGTDLAPAHRRLRSKFRDNCNIGPIIRTLTTVSHGLTRTVGSSNPKRKTSRSKIASTFWTAARRVHTCAPSRV
jgi:outer membrane protein TolC